MKKWMTFSLKIIFSALLINSLIHHVKANKKKKVIIKVPSHVKHVYHHHLKTVHIQQPSKKEHHIHHDHHEDVVHEHHHDREDRKGKRPSAKGFGSWRGLDSDDVKYSRDYRGDYRSLNRERPPTISIAHDEERPPPLPEKYSDDEYVKDDHGSWKPIREKKWREDKFGKRPYSSHGRHKGVVYEPDPYRTKNYENSKRYEDVDLTYSSSINDEKYRTDRPTPSFYQEHPYTSTSIKPPPRINNYDSPRSNVYKSTTSSYNDYYAPFMTTQGHPNTNYNYDGNLPRHIGYPPTESKINNWNGIVTSPMSVWPETTTSMPAIITSVWPDMKSSWLLNNNYQGNTFSQTNHSGKVTAATSYVYHNHGGTSTSAAQETMAKPILSSNQFQQPLTKPASSSYSVQVVHHG